MKKSTVSRAAAVLAILAALFNACFYFIEFYGLESDIYRYLWFAAFPKLVLTGAIAVSVFSTKCLWILPVFPAVWSVLVAVEGLYYESLMLIVAGVALTACGVFGLVSVVRKQKRALRILLFTLQSLGLLVWECEWVVQRIYSNQPMNLGIVLLALVNMLVFVAIIVWAAHRTPTEKLVQLKAKFEKGKLTEEAYAAKKAALLKQL